MIELGRSVATAGATGDSPSGGLNNCFVDGVSEAAAGSFWAEIGEDDGVSRSGGSVTTVLPGVPVFSSAIVGLGGTGAEFVLALILEDLMPWAEARTRADAMRVHSNY